jgi:hypothetical protein
MSSSTTTTINKFKMMKPKEWSNTLRSGGNVNKENNRKDGDDNKITARNVNNDNKTTITASIRGNQEKLERERVFWELDNNNKQPTIMIKPKVKQVLFSASGSNNIFKQISINHLQGINDAQRERNEFGNHLNGLIASLESKMVIPLFVDNQIEQVSDVVQNDTFASENASTVVVSTVRDNHHNGEVVEEKLLTDVDKTNTADHTIITNSSSDSSNQVVVVVDDVDSFCTTATVTTIASTNHSEDDKPKCKPCIENHITIQHLTKQQNYLKRQVIDIEKHECKVKNELSRFVNQLNELLVMKKNSTQHGTNSDTNNSNIIICHNNDDTFCMDNQLDKNKEKEGDNNKQQQQQRSNKDGGSLLLNIVHVEKMNDDSFADKQPSNQDSVVSSSNTLLLNTVCNTCIESEIIIKQLKEQIRQLHIRVTNAKTTIENINQRHVELVRGLNKKLVG